MEDPNVDRIRLSLERHQRVEKIQNTADILGLFLDIKKTLQPHEWLNVAGDSIEAVQTRIQKETFDDDMLSQQLDPIAANAIGLGLFPQDPSFEAKIFITKLLYLGGNQLKDNPDDIVFIAPILTRRLQRGGVIVKPNEKLPQEVIVEEIESILSSGASPAPVKYVGGDHRKPIQ